MESKLVRKTNDNHHKRKGHSKMSKEQNSKESKFNGKRVLNAIIAVVMALIVASMAWSAYTIWNGLDGDLPKIFIAPQIAFTLYLITTAFLAKGTK